MTHANLAIIITCYNRRNTTLNCLRALYKQKQPFDVYLTDDCSPDGTAEAVKDNYPKVRIFHGNGNLYWVGGMRLAFSEAIKNGYEYYLWLNDDTLLEENVLDKLLQIHQELIKQGYDSSILVGSTKDPTTGKATYGGAIKSKKWYSNKYEFIQPSDEITKCDTMYGNCVLIPASVAAKVGNLDSAFIHNLGDLDYGLRARKLGCSVWIAPGYVGTCSKNSVRGSWVDTKLSTRERLKRAFDVKNFPIKSWTVFTMRHSGFLWFVYWFLPYLRAVVGYRNLSVSPTFTEEISEQS